MSSEDKEPFNAMAAQKNAEAAGPNSKPEPPKTKKKSKPTAYQLFLKQKMVELAKLEWPSADKMKEIGSQWWE